MDEFNHIFQKNQVIKEKKKKTRVETLHSFNYYVAKELGVAKAVILYDLFNFKEHKADKNYHTYNGVTWCRYTGGKVNDKFSYINENTARRHLKELEEAGYIFGAELGVNRWKRDKWYCLNVKFFNDIINGSIHLKEDFTNWILKAKDSLNLHFKPKRKLNKGASLVARSSRLENIQSGIQKYHDRLIDTSDEFLILNNNIVSCDFFCLNDLQVKRSLNETINDEKTRAKTIHSFNPYVAIKVGIPKAIILFDMFNYTNYKNENDFFTYDNMTWCRYTGRSINEKYEYINTHTARRHLRQLSDMGCILSKELGINGLKRDKWHCLNKSFYNDLIEDKTSPKFNIEQWILKAENSVDLYFKAKENKVNNCTINDEKSQILNTENTQDSKPYFHFSTSSDHFARYPINDILHVKNSDLNVQNVFLNVQNDCSYYIQPSYIQSSNTLFDKNNKLFLSQQISNFPFFSSFDTSLDKKNKGLEKAKEFTICYVPKKEREKETKVTIYKDIKIKKVTAELNKISQLLIELTKQKNKENEIAQVTAELNKISKLLIELTNKKTKDKEIEKVTAVPIASRNCCPVVVTGFFPTPFAPPVKTTKPKATTLPPVSFDTSKYPFEIIITQKGKYDINRMRIEIYEHWHSVLYPDIDSNLNPKEIKQLQNIFKRLQKSTIKDFEKNEKVISELELQFETLNRMYNFFRVATEVADQWLRSHFKPSILIDKISDVKRMYVEQRKEVLKKRFNSAELTSVGQNINFDRSYLLFMFKVLDRTRTLRQEKLSNDEFLNLISGKDSSIISKVDFDADKLERINKTRGITFDKAAFKEKRIKRLIHEAIRDFDNSSNNNYDKLRRSTLPFYWKLIEVLQIKNSTQK